jgi:hypothetical protein
LFDERNQILQLHFLCTVHPLFACELDHLFLHWQTRVTQLLDWTVDNARGTRI